MTPLNVTGKDFCNAIGIAYNGDLLKELRNLKLVNFFKIGKKYMYRYEDIEKVSNKLRKGEISIKTNKGYYITLNN